MFRVIACCFDCSGSECRPVNRTSEGKGIFSLVVYLSFENSRLKRIYGGFHRVVPSNGFGAKSNNLWVMDEKAHTFYPEK
jgi:hypothetical protein